MYGKRLWKISRAESYFRIYTKICSKAEGIKPVTTYSLRSSEMQLHMVIPSTANNDTRNADLKEKFSVVLQDIFTENVVILGDFHLKTPLTPKVLNGITVAEACKYWVQTQYSQCIYTNSDQIYATHGAYTCFLAYWNTMERLRALLKVIDHKQKVINNSHITIKAPD